MQREVTQSLIQIQALDVRIMGIEEELAGLPEEYALEEQALRQAKELHAQEEEQLRASRIDAQHAESDINAQDEKIKKYSALLATAKSNKEYQLIVGQVNGAKLDLARAEEAGLVALERVEKLLAELNASAEDVKRKEAAVGAAKGRVAGRMQELQTDIERLAGERLALAAQLEPELVKVYDHIRERREGVALVQVVDGTCQGCFVKVTAQEQMLLNQRDELVRCRTCSRILVLPD